MSDAAYIHGSSEDERARLSLLNDLLNARSLAEARIASGDAVLDVGSGLGQLTRALRRAAGPGGRTVGVERSDAQRARAAALAREAGEEGAVDFRAGDATALPLAEAEWGSFDVVHGRFILEHVQDPAAVVAQMVRAARPGGRILLADDDHDVMRLHPEPPGFRLAWGGLVRGYDRLGCDPYVGRRLPALLHAAGARPARATWIFFGACAGEPAFPGFVANLAGNLSGARATIVGTGLVDDAGLDATLAGLDAFARRPDAAIWYATAFCEGVRVA
jgi:SAM-dependent methyltransferase